MLQKHEGENVLRDSACLFTLSNCVYSGCRCYCIIICSVLLNAICMCDMYYSKPVAAA